MYKDDKKGEAKNTIVMDFCTDVVKVRMSLKVFNNLKKTQFFLEFETWKVLF